MSAVCADCKLEYSEFPCDMNVSDEVWERITPDPERPGCGILCPTCICVRLIALPGISWVYAEPRGKDANQN